MDKKAFVGDGDDGRDPSLQGARRAMSREKKGCWILDVNVLPDQRRAKERVKRQSVRVQRGIFITDQDSCLSEVG
jgi:hypothetical protein